jgi:hypothetical protein
LLGGRSLPQELSISSLPFFTTEEEQRRVGKFLQITNLDKQEFFAELKKQIAELRHWGGTVLTKQPDALTDGLASFVYIPTTTVHAATLLTF